MNEMRVKEFAAEYLQATGSRIIEMGRRHILVKLSPEADKQLTNRPFYWGFVERTGVEPETMTFLFQFGPTDEAAPVKTQLPGRVVSERITFGSRRLEDIFKACKAKGKFVNLFEQPAEGARISGRSSTCTTWFAVNYKIEFACDMKRDELHSLGISLSTGEIVENFYPIICNRQLSPKLPAYTQLKETISLTTALIHLERHLENKLKTYDTAWAEEAKMRLAEELDRVSGYYEPMLASAGKEEQAEIRTKFQSRIAEINWHYSPRILVNAVNCGLFHLLREPVGKT
ncbi:MAG TPA: YqhG family protein [Bacilli bacterium]